jgi:hypothetical protein
MNNEGKAKRHASLNETLWKGVLHWNENTFQMPSLQLYMMFNADRNLLLQS